MTALEMKVGNWKRGKFTISVYGGTEQRQGFVAFPWAIDKEVDCNHVLTHTPSGKAVARRHTRAECQKVAESLQTLAVDWSAPEPFARASREERDKATEICATNFLR